MLKKVLLCFVAAGSVMCPGVASAQQDFNGLKLMQGDKVVVIEPTGEKIAGVVLELSNDALRFDGRTIRPKIGLKIQRMGDPIWDGAIKGLLIGAVVGALASSGECGVKWSFGQCALAGAGWGTVFGTGIDWLHTARTTVYLGVGKVTGANSLLGQHLNSTANTSAFVRFAF